MQAKRIAEERKMMLRAKFKQVARSALVNRFWLLDERTNKSNIMNFPKASGILTPANKGLLRKHPDLRTIEERRGLVKMVADLLVFASIPPKLRARLSPRVYYILVQPGHKLMKQNRIPASVYFILTGDVEVFQKSINPVTKADVEKIEYISGPGDWLGEVDIIENVNRKYTYISITEVELLGLDREDFDNILMPYVKKMWEAKKVALSQFKYFDFFTPEQRSLTCQFSALQQYEPYESIYSEDKGLASHVHFVLSGRCMILQCLKMMVTVKHGQKSFKLKESEEDEDFTKFMTNMEIRSFLRRETIKEFESAIVPDEDVLSADDIVRKKPEHVVDMAAIEKSCAELQARLEQRRSKLSKQLDKIAFIRTQDSKEEFEGLEVEDEVENISEENSENYVGASSVSFHSNISKVSTLLSASGKHPSDTLDAEEDLACEQSTVTGSKISSYSSYFCKPTKLRLSDEIEVKMEDHFIDVGYISHGGIFGLGEQMKHRIIMAENNVQCLKIPRFWLLERAQNPRNIWQRLRMQIDISLPSREMLFENFLRTRKWQAYKQNVVNNAIKGWGGNPTKIQDVPIMGRIISSED